MSRKLLQRILSCYLLSGIMFGLVAPAGAEIPLVQRIENQPVESIPTQLTVEVSEPVIPKLSPAVRDLPSEDIRGLEQREVPLRNFFGERALEGTNTHIRDPLAANSLNQLNTPAPLLNFEGMGNFGLYTPPDTTGDVGPNHYIQMVNVSFSIYDKAGIQLAGPIANNALWTGFGGPCENDNDGDPIVLYDDMADRWLLTQFADILVSKLECLAISTTPDPLGTYYLYAFSTPEVPDYPKFGVWLDGYYMGTNSGYPGGYYAFAFDRVNMLAGAPATMQWFGTDANFLMPADADGLIPPPSGSPGYFYTYYKNGYPDHPPGPDRLAIYEFDVDWAIPGNSTFALVTEIPISSFNYTVCGFFVGDCIPQPGTAQGLDSLSYWPMVRLQYRNFGPYEAMVSNFTVDLDGTDKAAIRWFELRKVGANPWGLYQEGTYAPDNSHRWMGSIAMDGSGNIALGYSVSDDTVTKPAIRYAIHEVSDPLGTMQAEASLIEGNGVQTSTHRWGDYSAMNVDPTDQCTFWMTNEYHQVDDAGFSWDTRIGTFKVPGCTGSIGTLSGIVIDSITTIPITNANIEAVHIITPTIEFNAMTNVDGEYEMMPSVGVYTTTASAFGYFPASVYNVEVFPDTVTTLDFALDPAPTYLVEGTVTDVNTGWPLYAEVNTNSPAGSVWTDPVTGYYSIMLPEGVAYDFEVSAWVAGYVPEMRVVGPLTGDTVEDFTLDVHVGLCIAPGYEVGTLNNGVVSQEEPNIESLDVMHGESTTNNTVPWVMEVLNNRSSSPEGALTLMDVVAEPSLLPSGRSVAGEQVESLAPLALTYYANRATFDADFPGLPIEDFEEGNVSPGGVIGCDAPLDETNNDTCFSPGDILPGILFQDNPGPDSDGLVLLGTGFNNNPSKQVLANTFVDSYDIYFTTMDTYAAGMDLASHFNADMVQITIYGPGGIILDTTSASSTNSGSFWGVASNQYLTRINIDSPTNQAEGVDNVAFGGDPCIPQPGGLVVGNVYDNNTLDGLVGALVQSDEGEMFTTEPTPGDPNVDDGFYTLFASPGDHDITAGEDGYTDDLQTVSVVDGDTVGQDFFLDAPWLAPTPDTFQVTVAQGYSLTEMLNLDNMGGVDADFDVFEFYGGFNPVVAQHAAGGTISWNYRNEEGVIVELSDSGYKVAYPGSYQYVPDVPTIQPNVLVYTDDWIHTTPNTLVQQAITMLGIPATVYVDGDYAGFETDLTTGGPWDLVIWSGENYTIPSTTIQALLNYVQGGGKLAATYWRQLNIPSDPLWAEMGFQYISNYVVPSPAYWWDTGHPIFNNPESAPEWINRVQNSGTSQGTNLEPLANGLAVAGYTTTPMPNEVGMVIRDDGFTVYKGIRDVSTNADDDMDGVLDGVELWENIITGLLGGWEVPWLFEDPISGTIPALMPLDIQVTFDASVPEVPSEGDYLADLVVIASSSYGDSPYGNLTIPVTMSVVAPYEPEVSFTVTPTLLVDYPATFTNTSDPGQPPAEEFLWDFGDGNSLIAGLEDVAHTYANTGTYTVTLFAENPIGDDTFTMVVDVITEADLSISKIADPDPVSTGGDLAYTLTVNNFGPNDAMNVVVIDTLPVGMTFISASLGCTEGGGVVTCSISDLANGSSLDLSIMVLAPPIAGTIINMVEVTSNANDPDMVNNTFSLDTTVEIGKVYLPFINKP